MSYYSQVLPLVFQWSLCHHFVVRVYAAGSVLEMWRECKNLEFDSQQYSTISSLEQFIPFIENYRLIIEVDYTSILHSFIHSSISHSSIYSFINLSIHPFIHSSIYPFIHSSIYPFIHSSIHPFHGLHPLSSDVAKSKKLESNIFFKLFHPLEDLNLQVSNILYFSEANKTYFIII